MQLVISVIYIVRPNFDNLILQNTKIQFKIYNKTVSSFLRVTQPESNERRHR